MAAGLPVYVSLFGRDTLTVSPRRWLSLTIGLALCGTVIIIGFRFSEADDFVRFARRARPTLLVLAAAWQLDTYGAQAEIWRLVSRRLVRAHKAGSSLAGG
jgi:hypothetical protein